MRMIFGVLSLLLALAVVGFLVKKQMPSINALKLPDGTLPNNSSPTRSGSPTEPTGTGALMPSPVSPGSPANPTLTPSAPLITSPNVQQQSQLIQQQVQQQLRAATEAALQQTRPVQDEK